MFKRQACRGVTPVCGAGPADGHTKASQQSRRTSTSASSRSGDRFLAVGTSTLWILGPPCEPDAALHTGSQAVRTCTHRHGHTQACTHACTRTGSLATKRHMHTTWVTGNACTCTHRHTCTQTHTWPHGCTHICIHGLMDTGTHAHIPGLTGTHMHCHVHAQAHARAVVWNGGFPARGCPRCVARLQNHICN